MMNFPDLAKSLPLLAVLGFSHSTPAWAQEVPPPGQPAKLRLVMKEPVATNLHVSVVETGGCKPVSDLWVTGGQKRFYANRVGMLASSPPREGIIEMEAPGNVAIGIPSNTHIAKLGWGEILFSMNPAMHGSIRAKQPGVCDVPVFTPRSGGQYEVSFEAGPDFCRVAVDELTGAEGNVVRTQVADESLVVRRVGRKKYSCNAP